MRTTYTWEQFAGLYGKIDIDAFDFVVPAGAKDTFVADELRDRLGSGQDGTDVGFAKHLGFVLDSHGVTFDDASLRLAHVLDFVLAVDAFDEGEVEAGTLAHALGYRTGKAINKTCYRLADAVDLVHAMRGEPVGNRIPGVTEADQADIIVRAHAWKMPVAA